MKQYPPRVRIKMSDHFPDIVVPDFIFNVAFCTMVSHGAKEALEQHSEALIEFLPFTLLNHKGRVAAAECFIANVLTTVDCADTTRTVGVPSQMSPGTYLEINRLELDEAKIPPTARLFRLKQLPSAMVVREDLRAQLSARGLTGLAFVETGEDCDLRD
ncbi:imm11 family protein [Pyxidicoccus xibeiensis]|uniref:imm11 family protein n=1 Tax=Pyxidicoccus xibeiensis TaxID=2906759 RepID=UPI002B1FF660|nr:DUF1629 domain-containing protein [Pyxidicoccus xibeiensis]MCP3143593.1 hypothetical protein [Pyxidicoccus xibeiensis]